MQLCPFLAVCEHEVHQDGYGTIIPKLGMQMVFFPRLLYSQEGQPQYLHFSLVGLQIHLDDHLGGGALEGRVLLPAGSVAAEQLSSLEGHLRVPAVADALYHLLQAPLPARSEAHVTYCLQYPPCRSSYLL